MRCALSIFLLLSLACGGSEKKPTPAPEVKPEVSKAELLEAERAKKAEEAAQAKKLRVERSLALMASMTAIVNELADAATNAKNCKALAVGFNAWADKYAGGGEIDGEKVTKTEAMNAEGSKLAISTEERGSQHEASEAAFAQARERYQALRILKRCENNRALAKGLKEGFGGVIGPIPDDFSGWYLGADAEPPTE